MLARWKREQEEYKDRAFPAGEARRERIWKKKTA